MTNAINLNLEILDGKKYLSAVIKGVEYTISYDDFSKYSLMTNRLSIANNIPKCSFYNTLPELANSRKCLRGIDILIQGVL